MVTATRAEKEREESTPACCEDAIVDGKPRGKRENAGKGLGGSEGGNERGRRKKHKRQGDLVVVVMGEELKLRSAQLVMVMEVMI